MQRSLTVREKNLIAVAVTIVFCALFAVYFILPAWDRYTETRGRLPAKNAAAGQNKAMSGDIGAVRNELDSLRKQLPENPDTAELLFYLNKAAEKTGVALTGLTFENSAPGQTASGDADVRPLYGRMRVSGTFAQIRAFLGQTEDLPRITHNRAVTINEPRDVSGKLEGIIEFSAFVAHYGNSRYRNPSDVPPAPGGRQTLFRY